MNRQFVAMVCSSLMGLAMSAPVAAAPADPAPLARIKAAEPPVGAGDESEGSFSGIRDKSIRQAVYTYAVQEAVHWRYQQILKEIDAVSTQLDRVFDFSVVALDQGRVLPPVITQAGKTWKALSSTASETSRKTFEIRRPARVISNPPTWRRYLIQDYPAGEKPHPALYPRDDEEQAIWDAAAERGWQNGYAFAMQLYNTNLNRLKRDFNGMILFKRLVNQNIISVPRSARNEPRIVVNGETLEIGKRLFRITLPSSWQETGKWQPAAALEGR